MNTNKNESLRCNYCGAVDYPIRQTASGLQPGPHKIPTDPVGFCVYGTLVAGEDDAPTL